MRLLVACERFGRVRDAFRARGHGLVCHGNGLHFYHQTDPRGCALYVSREPLTDQNYSGRGIAMVTA